MTEEGVRQTKSWARVCFLILIVQMVYSLFETIRHLLVDGMGPHPLQHFLSFGVCGFLFVIYYVSFKEVFLDFLERRNEDGF